MWRKENDEENEEKGEESEGKGEDTPQSWKVARRRKGGKENYADFVDDLGRVLAGIPGRPSISLMTASELEQTFGAKPKKNKVLRKMSTRYRAIETALNQCHSMVDNALVAILHDQERGAQFKKELDARLSEVEVAADAYIIRHSKKAKSKKKVEAANVLLSQAKSLRGNVDVLLAAVADPMERLSEEDRRAAQDAKIQPGQLKGVCPRYCGFAELNDRTCDRPAKLLKEGGCNEAFSVSYNGKRGVFKEEKTKDNKAGNSAIIIGIDFDNGPRYGNRNIASGVIGKGLGTTVMPPCCFAISEGKVGLLMPHAPGQTASGCIADIKADKVKISDEALASLQRQLMELEVCDIVTGQADRHDENYMVYIKGDEVTVTAIDNDIAFPHPGKLGVTGPSAKKIPLAFAQVNSIRSLPRLIGSDMAERILNINFEKEIAVGLVDLLDPAEIAAAGVRLEALKDHIKTLEKNGCVVGNWKEWRSRDKPPLTAAEYLAKDSPTTKSGALKLKQLKTSLFDRDFAQALGVRE